MKIRNKSPRIDIQKIYIDKSDNGTNVMLIINDKLYKMQNSSIYISDIFEKIEKELEVMSYEERYQIYH